MGLRKKIDRYYFLSAVLAFKQVLLYSVSDLSLIIARSDLQGICTNAKQDGDDWILNGSKTFITNGYNADVVIVVAVTNAEAKSPAHG